MNDVIEYLIDGTSGLAPGDVSGSAVIVGVCSKGTVGKAYLLGKRSDLTERLGTGPLVDRLRDVFATGGQEPTVIAVPVEGLPGGYIGNVGHTGSGPDAAVSGVAGANADAVVQIVVAGQLGTATYKLSLDGGETWGNATATPANGQIILGESGAVLTLAEGAHVENDAYAVTVRGPIGPVKRIGAGPTITVTGTVKAGAEVVLLVTGAGGRNVGTYQLSEDGGDNWGPVRTIPVDGAIPVSSTGVTVTVPDEDLTLGTEYHCRLNAPVPSITAVMGALETPLALYDPEFVYIVGPSDAVDWAACGVRADELWNQHRPTYIKTEFRLPYDGEDLNDWVAAWKTERARYSHRFVQSIAAFGEVSDSTGLRRLRNWGGLQCGRVLSIPVHRATGRVSDGPVSQGTLPDGWVENGIHEALEDAGAVSAKMYAGLSGVYWGDSRTLAEPTSDYRYEEILRVVFKAVRLARIAALKSMYDEAGDPALEGNASGLAYLKGSIENALDTMTKATPREMVGYVVAIPSGQDIVNNGVGVEQTLIGVPIIRKIKLFSNFTYAGSNFDPRLKEVA
ncbi:hypothetical protein BerOc1_02976 [Pseudodesulfovibrio hydrargyri]|uniref:Uncharacterized protein n=1 Tax=Pseudodesulfovibrio hydrargyri TaxID=2125990 RepID=A0A1J5NCS2_9BACT|nr:DUF2586 domain-containing protein [Pseudodesulfovibrio hydrargyri]OIQ51031.1 hypothetical protein BerOc1_02976 [Pseudodesulfovibrio hydrargyri]